MDNKTNERNHLQRPNDPVLFRASNDVDNEILINIVQNDSLDFHDLSVWELRECR